MNKNLVLTIVFSLVILFQPVSQIRCDGISISKPVLSGAIMGAILYSWQQETLGKILPVILAGGSTGFFLSELYNGNLLKVLAHFKGASAASPSKPSTGTVSTSPTVKSVGGKGKYIGTAIVLLSIVAYICNKAD